MEYSTRRCCASWLFESFRGASSYIRSISDNMMWSSKARHAVVVLCYKEICHFARPETSPFVVLPTSGYSVAERCRRRHARLSSQFGLDKLDFLLIRRFPVLPAIPAVSNQLHSGRPTSRKAYVYGQEGPTAVLLELYQTRQVDRDPAQDGQPGFRT